MLIVENCGRLAKYCESAKGTLSLVKPSSSNRGMIILEASKGILFSIVKHSSGAVVGADSEAVVTRTSRYAAYVVGEVLNGNQMAFTLRLDT